jgi:hypothetical protein
VPTPFSTELHQAGTVVLPRKARGGDRGAASFANVGLAEFPRNYTVPKGLGTGIFFLPRNYTVDLREMPQILPRNRTLWNSGVPEAVL